MATEINERLTQTVELALAQGLVEAGDHTRPASDNEDGSSNISSDADAEDV